MFKWISYQLALQFMAFVFLLLLVNGTLFLAADFGNAQRENQFRLLRTSQQIIERASAAVDLPYSLPLPLRGRVRVADAAGRILYQGDVLAEIPFVAQTGFSEAVIQGEPHLILTTPIVEGGRTAGYMQIAEVKRFQFEELPFRGLLYSLVSVVISLLTFFVGLFFARRSLKPAEQMVERLEQFTQDASHELRTPLAALSSSLDLALRTQNYREGIESAKEDVREVTVLVERLLELARLDQFLLRTSPVDLSGLVQEAATTYRALAAERGATIESTIEPGVTVRGDASLLRQVIANLLSNAIKFGKPGGSAIVVRLTRDRLSVEDAGVGIAADALPHVFDRFYQADSSRSKEGYGLGLALVKRAVDLHGWTIAARSETGKGTTFTIFFSAKA